MREDSVSSSEAELGQGRVLRRKEAYGHEYGVPHLVGTRREERGVCQECVVGPEGWALPLSGSFSSESGSS